MSHNGRQGRMSEAVVSGAVILEEPETAGATSGARGESQNQDRAPLRCPFWPFRQQTWLCVVPLLIGFIGLGLSLMLLKWIVVGTVRDYVPTDLVDANRQDPIFLSKPSGIPKNADTTTTTTGITPTMEPGNPTPRTAGKGRTRFTATTTAGNHRGGGAYGSQVTPRNPGNRNGRHGFTTTTTAPRTTYTIGAATSSPSPHNPTVLHDSTAMWTPEHTTTEATSTTLTTRSHGHRKTPSPTVPPLHSEHFKPCHEKDLAYCLNGGECFVIETLSGPHKHCKCREGYQGIRCDQFLPKTDSILSDPNHLGIEFMESKEVYKRQVLSVTSITMTISLLGMICMALYCRNKRRREKLQAHLKENRSLKNYNSQNALGEKARMPGSSLQMHQYCKRPPLCDAGCNHGNLSCPTTCSRGTTKPHKSGSLSQSQSQKSRTAHWSAPRRTPPISRGRLNPIGGPKYSGPAYQHLHEVDASEKEAEAQRGSQSNGESQYADPRQDTFLHIQTSVSMETSALCSSNSTNSRSFHQHPDTAFRSCSIPIIPSVHCHHDSETSCMQTMSVAPGNDDMGFKTPPTSCSSVIGRQQDEVAFLLEEAQEQLRALAHRKQEESAAILEPRETVCFLNLNAGSAVGFDPPTHTQLLSQSHRDLIYSGQ